MSWWWDTDKDAWIKIGRYMVLAKHEPVAKPKTSEFEQLLEVVQYPIQIPELIRRFLDNPQTQTPPSETNPPQGGNP